LSLERLRKKYLSLCLRKQSSSSPSCLLLNIAVVMQMVIYEDRWTSIPNPSADQVNRSLANEDIGYRARGRIPCRSITACGRCLYCVLCLGLSSQPAEPLCRLTRGACGIETKVQPCPFYTTQSPIQSIPSERDGSCFLLRTQQRRTISWVALAPGPLDSGSHDRILCITHVDVFDDCFACR
jgi:hypothetical protein